MVQREPNRVRRKKTGLSVKTRLLGQWGGAACDIRSILLRPVFCPIISRRKPSLVVGT